MIYLIRPGEPLQCTALRLCYEVARRFGFGPAFVHVDAGALAAAIGRLERAPPGSITPLIILVYNERFSIEIQLYDPSRTYRKNEQLELFPELAVRQPQPQVLDDADPE